MVFQGDKIVDDVLSFLIVAGLILIAWILNSVKFNIAFKDIYDKLIG